MSGGDVEENDLVRAGIAVTLREFGGVAGIAQIHELDAFDDAAVVDVEAGDDAFGQHVLFKMSDRAKVGEKPESRLTGFFRVKLNAE